MSKTYLIIIAVLTLIVIFQMFSTNEVIVCSNGDVVETIFDCPRDPVPSINERQAETAVQNYGSAQAQARGDRFTRVNIYREDANFFSQTLFTNTQTNNVAELTFKIDGRTANVECIQGCEYLAPRQTESEDI
ncbi:MAG: hypothetical protein ACMXX9_01800 [Candidatus Woesearchaeota archaeon]